LRFTRRAFLDGIGTRRGRPPWLTAPDVWLFGCFDHSWFQEVVEADALVSHARTADLIVGSAMGGVAATNLPAA
jgi:hypothetical protein